MMSSTARTVALFLLIAGCESGPTLDAGTDGGSTVNDGGVDGGGVGDGGLLDSSADARVSMCREDLRSPFTGATPCSTETAACARACGDATCARGCFASDVSGQCLQCWDQNQIACWNRNGCQDEWNCIGECIRDNCPSITTECIRDNCQAEDLAYADCFEPLRLTCLERTVACLP